MDEKQKEALAKAKKVRDSIPGGSGMFQGPKESIFPKGASASTKAIILRDIIAKSKAMGSDQSLAKRMPGVPGIMQRRVSGMEKTAARLESQDSRKETSAKYRLAKAKADKKMSKESKTSKRANKFELNDGFIPTMNKALGIKKGKKK
jgi:hypothetical protein